jgi:hypothetical protein
LRHLGYFLKGQQKWTHFGLLFFEKAVLEHGLLLVSQGLRFGTLKFTFDVDILAFFDLATVLATFSKIGRIVFLSH